MLMAVFSTALFLSAALMFVIQPMAGKMLLPLVGGTPAGWIVAIAFFQLALLAGYLLAHALSRFSPRAHGALYIAALGFGLLFPPGALPQDFAPDAAGVFKALAQALAAPFAAIACSSSTLQRLFAATKHRSAEDPYFLYAASNAGSLAGLLLYPVLIEPALTLAQQEHLWNAGYRLLMLLAGCCGLFLPPAASAAEKTAPAGAAETVSPRQRLEWLALAFFPSALMLAVTTHVTTDVFSAPMVWVIPLSLYLVTFIIAFSRRPAVSMAFAEKLQPAATALALFLLLLFDARLRLSLGAMLVQILAFGATALLCHMRLARLRPPAGSRNLTEFYLIIAAGGALGGALNAFVFPALLDRLAEYPVLLVLACLLHPRFRTPLPWLAEARFLLPALAAAALYAAHAIIDPSSTMPTVDAVYDVLIAGTFALLCFHPRLLMIGGAVLYIFLELLLPTNTLRLTRNFFGVVRVFEQPLRIENQTVTARYMYHGTTTHGFQIQDPRYAATPTAYFTAAGPVGDIFAIYNPHDILVMGLGVGTLNCYSRPDNRFTFIEIDPAVITAAREDFTYLSACKGSRPPRIVTGDGRLELKKMADEKFDIIILDAFSSDAIPTHLVTKEAIEIYLDHLAPGGLLLFNIANRYFNLGQILAANAEAAGLKSRFRIDPEPQMPYAYPGKWAVMGRQGVSFQPLADMGWEEIPPAPKPWTDDDTSILSALTSQF